MSKAAQIDPILAELVDTFAPLRQEVEAFRPTQNHHDRLWDKLRPYLATAPQNQPAVLKGKQYEIHVSECATKRHVLPKAVEKLKKVFGFRRFTELVAGVFPVTPIDALLRPEQQAGIVESRQDGSRRIIAVVDLMPDKAA